MAVKGVVEVAPIAYTQKTSGASDRVPATEALQSLLGYVTIIPDFLGYGVSKDTPYCTFLNVANIGMVGYHMRQASREFLRTIGYELPDRTMLAGYSLGGSSAMAMLRYYDLMSTPKPATAAMPSSQRSSTPWTITSI